MLKELHVIFGTGPVGCWTARSLRKMGITVRAINRSGKRPQLMPEDVEIAAADLSDPRKAIDAAKGATVLYQALNPPYAKWHEQFPALQAAAIAAAKTVGARYISIDNLYMYDPSTPMSENSPSKPLSSKGTLRAKMAEEVLSAHQRGEINAAILRSSDYYGPGVVNSALGQRFFGSLVSGKKAQIIGSANKPHSWAYIEDVGQAAAIIGNNENALGQIWITPHAPSCTQKQIVEKACELLGRAPKFALISPLMMRIVGLFIPEARASVEMMYQFTEPFIVESNRFQQRFGLKPTLLDIGIEKTIKWYQAN